MINKKYYYLFKDLEFEANEKKANYTKKVTQDNFNYNAFKEESNSYGTIAFESNN